MGHNCGARPWRLLRQWRCGIAVNVSGGLLGNHSNMVVGVFPLRRGESWPVATDMFLFHRTWIRPGLGTGRKDCVGGIHTYANVGKVWSGFLAGRAKGRWNNKVDKRHGREASGPGRRGITGFATYGPLVLVYETRASSRCSGYQAPQCKYSSSAARAEPMLNSSSDNDPAQ